MLHTRFGVCLVVVGALALSGCGGDDASPSGTAAATTPGSSNTDGAGATLTISGLAFSAVTSAAGESIAIVNDDGFGHTVTDRDGGFNVKVAGGATGELTIDQPGTYKIFCEIHSDMAGTIVVS
ncbi:MAG: cupredoxin domain-containing protein [Actinomycetota bacterium]|nr:cupredoxin domain-containing protein [Actinomycetota bacterium]